MMGTFSVFLWGVIMERLSVLLMILLIAGCATTYKINRVSLGMTKAEVIEVMGEEPTSSSAIEYVEYLRYSLWKDFWDRSPGNVSNEFFVRLRNGKVDAYGRAGDFVLTKKKKKKKTIDL
ncbi:MAG: hypothetical protein HZB83_05140, partial [Deltaproteobacteria bacterium]|nr:hypothetical protein [Deltaproteobacteria bacterium]